MSLDDDVQLRVLASAILFRACLRALAAKRMPTPEQKMALHARVEEMAWQLPYPLLLLVDGRDVDDGIPDSLEWASLVERLVDEAL